jgi:hypothetical protein
MWKTILNQLENSPQSGITGPESQDAADHGDNDQLPDLQMEYEDTLLTHAHGITRTYADIIIDRNEQKAFTSVDGVFTYLHNYLTRTEQSGDLAALAAVSLFRRVIEQDDLFTPSGLDVSRLRSELLDKSNLSEQIDRVYFEYCLEKICNIVAFLNLFRRYRDLDTVLKDLDFHTLKIRTSRKDYTGDWPFDSLEEILSPRYAGRGYPLFFLKKFLEENWDDISTNGVLDSTRLNELMFNNHERELKRYGIQKVIEKDYVADGPCHPEVFFPKRIGTGPVYVQKEGNKYVRSCGEGTGPNSIPNYLEVEIAYEVLMSDERYVTIWNASYSYILPKEDMTLPVLNRGEGVVTFDSVEEKRRFIEELRWKYHR